MSRTSRTDVYSAIDSERQYQDERGVEHSGAPHEHELESYLLYMEDYLTEARSQCAREWGKGAKEKALHTLRKVVALGVAAMEEHGAPLRRA